MRSSWILILVAVLAAGATGCKDQPPPKKKPAASVVTAPVHKGSVVVRATVPGSVQPERTATLLAQVEGEILALPRREGDPVRAGEVLVRIDPSRLEAALEEAEARRDLVEAELDEARRVLERDRALFEQQGLGQEAVERSETRLATLAAEVRQSEAGIAAIEAQLADTAVRAPFDGFVLERWAELGDVVNRGSRLLSVASRRLLVVARVSELDLPAVSAGVTVGLEADAIRGRGDRPPCSGEVSRVHPKIDSGTRAATVEIRPQPACEARLSPGMFVRVTLTTARRDGVLVVPVNAIVARPDGSQVVFVVEDQVAHQRSVRPGLEGEELVEVLDGPAEGDAVVVRGQEQLKDGAPVKVAGAGKGNAKAASSGEGAS